MTRRALYWWFLLVLWLTLRFTHIYAKDTKRTILVLYRSDLKPHLVILKELKERFPNYLTTMDLAEKETRFIPQHKKERVKLVVAIGSHALELAVRQFPLTPIAFSLVLNPWKIVASRTGRTIVGIGLFVDPDAQAKYFHRVFPKLKHIGIVFDQMESGHVVQLLTTALGKYDIVVDEVPVATSRDAIPAIDMLVSNGVEAFWLVPDRVVTTPPFLKSLMLHSIRGNIPVIGFSERTVMSGAAMGLIFTMEDVAHQTGDLVERILNGQIKKDLAVYPIINWRLEINSTVLKKMGFTISKGLRDSVYREY